METAYTSWEVGNQLVSTALTELLSAVQHDEPTFHSQWNTAEQLIYIMVKKPQMFFSFGHPGCLLVFCQLFRLPPYTYLAHTYFIFL